VRVKDLLERDLARPIEEIIKVDQTNEDVVYTEITEYIVTDRIRDQYYRVLKAIADGKSEPSEGTGVWISGFFGSGKSSFAKIIGYILGNKTVRGHSAGDLFSRQVEDERISDLVNYINTTVPTEVIMFDIAAERHVRQSTEHMSELMYRNLLRALDYAEDFDLAELEIDLEAEGKLAEFIQVCEGRYGAWRTVRKSAQKFSRASAILHEMDPATYPSPDSWDQSVQGRNVVLTVDSFTKRVFELMARRRPGKAVAFVIDEVGQFVARSEDKIEDLRVVAEKLGRESRNRVASGSAPAPAWLVVTSQEKLEEVVAAIDSRRVQLAKLTDRFKYRADLSPADIREVATRRVLSKRPEAVPVLEQLFAENQGLLNTSCQLERSTRWHGLKQDEFVHFYPYLPHFIELSIDIVSGMRLTPGAPQHYGGSNRTIIKQVHEMLVSERTGVGERKVGALVPIDLISNLVEGNLPTEKQKDLSDIGARCPKDAENGDWPLRVAKAICLLEYVHDLPRTQRNLAALLVDKVGTPAPLEQVERALDWLAKAQFVRHAEDGWKLQTAQEKRWETERLAFLEPKPKDRNDIRREAAAAIFDDPKTRAFQFQGLKTLKVGVTLDGARPGDEGHIMVGLVSADDEQDAQARLDEVRTASRTSEGQNQVYWVFAMNPELDELIAQVYASKQMIAKYEQLRARGSATKDEQHCWKSEVDSKARLESRLKDKLAEAIGSGYCVFRGVARDASALGRTLPEILRALLNTVVPDLYPNLGMGACALGGDEAELILKSENLTGLPKVFYDGPGCLGLVVRDGNKVVLDTHAPIASEMLGFIESITNYGEIVTGKTIEDHFSGIGYGWDKDVMKTVLAALLRAGAIEVTYQGRRFVDAADPSARTPFTNNTAFRSATFAPRRALGLPILKRAVQCYESLTGDDVAMEEAVISAAVKQLCQAEQVALIRMEAVVSANQLPGAAGLKDYRSLVDRVMATESDEAVRILADDGERLRDMRDRAAVMKKALTEAGLSAIRRARLVLQEMWPALQSYQADGELARAASWLRDVLPSEKVYGAIAELVQRASSIEDSYRELYLMKHSERAELYHGALAAVRTHSAWELAPEAVREEALAKLAPRSCAHSELAPGTARCAVCGAGLAQIESDISAAHSLEAEALQQLAASCAPDCAQARVSIVRAADFFVGFIDSEHSMEAALTAFREHLKLLLEQDVRIRVE